MRSLVFIHKTEEVSPHSLLVYIRDPGDGLISLDLFESHIVAQSGPRQRVLRGHSQYVGECNVIPNHPRLRKVVNPEGLDITEVPRLIFFPEPGADGSALRQHFPRLIECQRKACAADLARSDDQRYVRVEDRLNRM